MAFQAEVDGQASTQEILARFKERLPPSQTPFFKALLTQICDFHRESSGKGIWSRFTNCVSRPVTPCLRLDSVAGERRGASTGPRQRL